MPVANPAAAFFTSLPVRFAATLLRGLDRVAPSLGTQAALRLFFTPMPTKLAARSRAVPLPWAAQRLPFEGGQVTVWRRGDVAPLSPRVLLVHGWAGDAQQLRALADQLAADGFDPVLLDLPAHGRSAGWRSNLPQWVRALFAVSGRLGPWHGVVAHSLGAMAVAHAAARGLPVQRLVLLALAPPPGQFLRWFAGALGLADTMSARMRSRIEQREGVPLNQFEAAWMAERLPQPALLVHDSGDLTAPLAGSQALVAGLKQGRLLVTDGLGHRRLLADPAVARQVRAHLLEAAPQAQPLQHPARART